MVIQACRFVNETTHDTTDQHSQKFEPVTSDRQTFTRRHSRFVRPFVSVPFGYRMDCPQPGIGGDRERDEVSHARSTVLLAVLFDHDFNPQVAGWTQRRPVALLRHLSVKRS